MPASQNLISRSTANDSETLICMLTSYPSHTWRMRALNHRFCFTNSISDMKKCSHSHSHHCHTTRHWAFPTYLHFQVRIPKSVLGLSLEEDSDFDKKENPAVDPFEIKRAWRTLKPNEEWRQYHKVKTKNPRSILAKHVEKNFCVH